MVATRINCTVGGFGDPTVSLRKKYSLILKTTDSNLGAFPQLDGLLKGSTTELMEAFDCDVDTPLVCFPGFVFVNDTLFGLEFESQVDRPLPIRRIIDNVKDHVDDCFLSPSGSVYFGMASGKLFVSPYEHKIVELCHNDGWVGFLDDHRRLFCIYRDIFRETNVIVPPGDKVLWLDDNKAVFSSGIVVDQQSGKTLPQKFPPDMKWVRDHFVGDGSVSGVSADGHVYLFKRQWDEVRKFQLADDTEPLENVRIFIPLHSRGTLICFLDGTWVYRERKKQPFEDVTQYFPKNVVDGAAWLGEAILRDAQGKIWKVNSPTCFDDSSERLSVVSREDTLSRIEVEGSKFFYQWILNHFENFVFRSVWQPGNNDVEVQTIKNATSSSLEIFCALSCLTVWGISKTAAKFNSYLPRIVPLVRLKAEAEDFAAGVPEGW